MPTKKNKKILKSVRRMNVEFSKAFVKASKRLSGKMLDSLRRTIVEVKAAKGIQDISDCKKLVGYHYIIQSPMYLHH